ANFQEQSGSSVLDAMARADEVTQLGPKLRTTVRELAELLQRATRMASGGSTVLTAEPTESEHEQAPAPVADVLKLTLDETGMIEKLREKRDPQDDARAENLEEFVAVAREFDVKN